MGVARRLLREQLESRIPLASSISGTVWEDLNGNAVRDYGETGIAGVHVLLDLNDNGAHDAVEPTVLTSSDDPLTRDVDETGRYIFGNLCPAFTLYARWFRRSWRRFPILNLR